MKRIGLIAGGGQFPNIFAEAAKKEGLEQIAAIFEETAFTIGFRHGIFLRYIQTITRGGGCR